MAYRHHQDAPAPDPNPAPAAQVPALPAPSMAASLATARATSASLCGEDDAAQAEHAAFHRHQMNTQVLADLWRQA